MKHRTFFYWPTRIVLVVAIGAVLLTILLFIAALQGMRGSWDPPFADLAYLIPAAGVVGALIGFAWMIRIFRGPRDEPPPWRYRDR